MGQTETYLSVLDALSFQVSSSAGSACAQRDKLDSQNIRNSASAPLSRAFEFFSLCIILAVCTWNRKGKHKTWSQFPKDIVKTKFCFYYASTQQESNCGGAIGSIPLIYLSTI